MIVGGFSRGAGPHWGERRGAGRGAMSGFYWTPVPEGLVGAVTGRLGQHKKADLVAEYDVRAEILSPFFFQFGLLPRRMAKIHSRVGPRRDEKDQSENGDEEKEAGHAEYKTVNGWLGRLGSVLGRWKLRTSAAPFESNLP